MNAKSMVEEFSAKLLRSLTEEIVEVVIDESIKAVEKVNNVSSTQAGNN